MSPPKKVYEKRKKDIESGSGTQHEPTSKKARISTSANPSDIPTTDHLQSTDCVVRTENVNEAVMQVVQQIKETQRSEEEEAEAEAEVEVEVESEGEEDDAPYDVVKFSSQRAQNNFEKYWCKRSVIVERGMNLSHFQTEEFQLKQNFERRGWSKWAQFNGTAVVPIVQEFYANMRGVKHEEKDCIITKVRGVDFRIYPKDIRKFFCLKEEKKPDFPFSEGEAVDKDSLARVLTEKNNAQWGHKLKLAKNRLSPKFNSLHFLACSQLNPILNTSEISYERGLLLYAIDKGMKVELGKIIFDSIASLFKSRKGISSLPFAGFITKFVCKNKVTSELGEQVAKPLGPITASSRERSISHKKGKGEATTAEFMERMYNTWDEVNVKLGEIKADQYWIKEELKKQGRKLLDLEAKVEVITAAVTICQSPHSI